MQQIDLKPGEYRRTKKMSAPIFWIVIGFWSLLLFWSIWDTGWNWGMLLRFGFPALLIGIFLGVRFRDSDF